MFGWASKGGHIAEADLSAYADGAVSPGLASRIDAHVATCNECATVLRELRTTKSLLSQLPTPTTTRSFVLGPEFATAGPPRRPASTRGFLSFAPAMTLSLLVVLLVVDLLPGGSKGSSNSAIPTGGLSSEKAAAASAPGLPPSPYALSQANQAPADSAPRVPAPLSGAGGAAAPTPQPAITGRSADSSAPTTATPSALGATAPRPPATQPVEGFNPAAASQAGTPLVASRPPLQNTAASAHGSGVSVLRILEILAALGFVASLGALVWDRKQP